MILSLPKFALAACVVFALGAAPAVFAEDAMAPAAGAMAPATDAMAPATDAMAPAGAMAPMMSNADLKKCLEQSAMITFPDVMKAASDACHGMHNGAIGGDAMTPKP